MPGRQELHSTLAKARQELQQAQRRVAELEAQIVEEQPNPSALTLSEPTSYHLLDALLTGCEIIGFDWRYRYINDAATHHKRRTRKAFLGHTIMELHPGIEKTPLFAVLQRSMHERRIERIETELSYPEGDAAWFELLIQPVPAGIFILSFDITAHKRTEVTFIENEQPFRLFVEHAPAALAMLDNEMRYLVVSHRWLTDYRLNATNVIGRSHYDLFPDLPAQWKEIHQRCLAGAVESSEADPFPRADGSLDWVRWEIHPWRKLDGTIGGILILSEVITERKRAEEKIGKLHRTLGVLSDINQAIVRIRHLPSLFEKACAIAVEKGTFRMAWIGLFDPQTGQLEPVTSAGLSTSDLEKISSTLNTPPLIPVLRAGARLICNDIQTDPLWLWLRAEALRLGYRAMVALPLIVAGEIRGSFNLYAGETDFFDEQEMRLLDEMAGDISFAIEVAEQDEQRQNAEAAVKRYAARMEILHQIDRGIINANSTAAIVETALQHIRRLIPCQRAHVGLLDIAKGEGVIFAVNAEDSTALGQALRLPISQDFFDGYDARHVKVVPDLRVLQETNPRFKQAVEEGLRSGLNVLLMDRDQPIGTLGIFANTPHYFTAEHEEIIIEVGSQLAIAIRQMELSEQLAQHMATLEQKVAERTVDLQKALEQVEAILNNSPDAILLVDADLTIQKTNQSFNLLFGAETDAYLGQSLRTLFHPDDVHHVSNLPQVAATRQNGKPLEARASRKDGTTFDAELNIGLIKGAGLVCIIRNITERKAQERQLRYHASIQESVSDAVIAADMHFRIQSWNRTAELIYGWRAAEAIGKSVNELLQTAYASAEDGERILRDFFERGAWQGEVIQHHRDGRQIQIHASVNLFKDETGQSIGVLSVNRDITERKRAAEALQKSAAEIHDLYNNAPCGYHSIDPDGLIVQINDTELRWLGYTRDEVIGRLRITALLAPESVLVFHKTLPEFMAQGWINDLQLVMVRKDGSIMHILLNATAIYDDDGQYLKSRSTLFDITDLQQAQRALAERETRYRLLAENISDVIAKMNPDGIRTFITPSCYSLLGYTPDELVGQPTIEIIHPADRPAMLAAISQAVSDAKTTFSSIRRFRHKAGHDVWVEATNNIIYDEDTGKPVEIIGVLRDVSERKRAEETLQKKMAEERQFQIYLKTLHEIIIELTGIDQLDMFYKRAVELGRARLGFERLAMFLYDEQDDSAVGTYGTDIDGKLIDERGVRFTPDPHGIMQRSFDRVERFYIHEGTTLYNDGLPVGYGWNAAAVLWNGTQSLGWFVADNLLSQAPAAKPLLDIMGLYALSIGTLLAQKQAQLALKESEEKFRLLLDAAPIATIISDQLGQISLVNVQAESLLGYGRDELIGRMIEILVPDYARDSHINSRIMYTATPCVRPMGLGMTLYAKHKDGSAIPVEIELSYIETQNGIMVMSFIMDITERKRIAAELEQQRSFLRNVIDVSPSMIFVKDYEGRFVLANPSVAAIYNTSIDALVGKTDADFNPTRKEVADFLAADRMVITSGERLFVEEPITNSTGQTHWLQTTKVPIVSADGKSKHVLGVSTDITERRAAEEALRESEEKYRSLVETMRGGLAVFDTEFRVTFVNDRFCELLGYSREETLGKHPTDFIAAVHMPLVQFHLARRQHAESTSYEVPLRHKDGRQIHVLLSGSPLFDKQGNYSGSIVVATDISLQKQAEETLRMALAKEKELGDLKTRFVSMASHEFRTPLATILALVETLSTYRNKLSDEQIEQRYDKIKAQIGHLKNIMEDVLMLSRMQARRVEFNPAKLDLDALSRSILDEFQSQPTITHKLEYTASAGIYEILLDPKLMRQLLNNLLSNAIKYSPKETVVRITLDYNDSEVILKVSDEGIGIPEADLPHLFEPFHRATNVGTISGTGLGLVIAREAVELHGGTITVESQQGVGTTFMIRIPRSR